MVVLNDFQNHLPRLFKQHIALSDMLSDGAEGKRKLQQDVDALQCMKWSDTDSMPIYWDRNSRQNVTYASKARLEMIVEYLKHQ